MCRINIAWKYIDITSHMQSINEGGENSEIHFWVPWIGNREVSVRGMYQIECGKAYIFQLVAYEYLCVECNGFI